MSPVDLNRELSVIGAAFVDRGDDQVVLVNRRADVAGEHAYIHPDVALGLRLHRIVQRQQTRAGARLDDTSMKALVGIVETPVVDRHYFAGALKFGVQAAQFSGKGVPLVWR